jgi:hypothetical protein
MVFILLKKPLEGQERNFKRILPDHINLQYGGGIGFISIGAGYCNKKDKLEGELYYGYLPRSIGGVRIHSLSAKFIWIPVHLSIKNNYKIEPLTTGILVNYNFGRQYFGFDPENYPYKYYSFPTAISTAIFIGSRFGFNKPGKLSVYYEVLSFDREILSLLTNTKSLDISDILNLSFGIRIDIK